MPSPKKNSFRNVVREDGYRSSLEKAIVKQLTSFKIKFGYETLVLDFIKPETKHTYTPDFILPNGIIIETKGRFMQEDREKHLLIKAQYPHLDIRFLFTNSKNVIYKGSKTTYREWCEKHGFKWADRIIPRTWINEMRGVKI